MVRHFTQAVGDNDVYVRNVEAVGSSPITSTGVVESTTLPDAHH